MFEQLKNLFGNLSNRSQSDDTNLSDAEIQALQDSGMLDDNNTIAICSQSCYSKQ